MLRHNSRNSIFKLLNWPKFLKILTKIGQKKKKKKHDFCHFFKSIAQIKNLKFEKTLPREVS